MMAAWRDRRWLDDFLRENPDALHGVTYALHDGVDEPVPIMPMESWVEYILWLHRVGRLTQAETQESMAWLAKKYAEAVSENGMVDL